MSYIWSGSGNSKAYSSKIRPYPRGSKTSIGSYLYGCLGLAPDCMRPTGEIALNPGPRVHSERVLGPQDPKIGRDRIYKRSFRPYLRMMAHTTNKPKSRESVVAKVNDRFEEMSATYNDVAAIITVASNVEPWNNRKRAMSPKRYKNN